MNPNEYITLQKDRQYLFLDDGKVISDYVMTTVGLEYIKNNLNHLTKDEKHAFLSVYPFFKDITTANAFYFSEDKKNDYPLDFVPVKIEDFVSAPSVDKFFVLSIEWRKTYKAKNALTAERLHKDLDFANKVNPFLNEFEGICKKMKVNFNKKALLSLSNVSKNIEKGVVQIKSEKEAANEITTETQAFVIAHESGFLNNGFFKPLDEAKLFFSEKEARKSIQKYNLDDKAVVVSVNIVLDKKICGPYINAVEDALALQQRKHLQKTLEQLEIQQLRDRLEELENKYNAPQTVKSSNKRKV